MKIIPIMWQHNPSRIVGKAVLSDKGLIFEIDQEIKLTKRDVFMMIGNPGIKVLEDVHEDGIRYITKFELIEWSVDPRPTITPPEE